MSEAEGCGWLVQVDAIAYHNRDLAAIEAAMTEAEYEAYGPPEPWYPDGPGDAYVTLPCGAETVGGRGLCHDHNDAMEMSDLEFEDALRRGVTWSNDHTPYD
jgi:hypothetical protein